MAAKHGWYQQQLNLRARVSSLDAGQDEVRPASLPRPLQLGGTAPDRCGELPGPPGGDDVRHCRHGGQGSPRQIVIIVSVIFYTEQMIC